MAAATAMPPSRRLPVTQHIPSSPAQDCAGQPAGHGMGAGLPGGGGALERLGHAAGGRGRGPCGRNVLDTRKVCESRCCCRCAPALAASCSPRPHAHVVLLLHPLPLQDPRQGILSSQPVPAPEGGAAAVWGGAARMPRRVCALPQVSWSVWEWQRGRSIRACAANCSARCSPSVRHQCRHFPNAPAATTWRAASTPGTAPRPRATLPSCCRSPTGRGAALTAARRCCCSPTCWPRMRCGGGAWSALGAWHVLRQGRTAGKRYNKGVKCPPADRADRPRVQLPARLRQPGAHGRAPGACGGVAHGVPWRCLQRVASAVQPMTLLAGRHCMDCRMGPA